MDAFDHRQGMPEVGVNMNGLFLDFDLGGEARAEEMRLFQKLDVYKRVPRGRVAQLGGKHG